MSSKVYVANLPSNFDVDELKELFKTVGEVLSIDVVKDAATGRIKGFAFVEMESEEIAAEAIQKLGGKEFGGNKLKVNEHRKKVRQSSGPDSDRMGEDSDRGAPMGYFRAQPLDLGLRKKKRPDPFSADEDLKIDYKNPTLLARFMSERGRILPRRMTGLSAYHQRKVSMAIKRAQQVALLPYIR